MHEGSAWARYFLAGEPAFADDYLQVRATDGQIFDPVLRPGLDAAGQSPAGRACGFSFDGFDKGLASVRFLGDCDDTVVGEV
ncbi:hypothetical protein GCM10010525_00030 [Glutamicibacter bergerei]